MLILLPPSEGKARPEGGEPVDLASLAFAEELREPRSRLLEALRRLGEEPVERAVAMLAISEGQAGEVALDAALASAPAAPAAAVYTGVLFDRLGFGSLPAAARRRAERRVLIASALWGFLRPSDRIPYYRLSAKARLPEAAPLAGWWRPWLAAAVPDEPGSLIVDMRSAAYAAAWRPRRASILGVRALSEREGRRKPVTHMAKAVRGEVARALLLEGAEPSDPAGIAEIVAAAGLEVELGEEALDVIIRD